MFLDIGANVDLMHLKDVLDVETEYGARIGREADINIDSQLLFQMFLVDDHITADPRVVKVDNGD